MSTFASYPPTYRAQEVQTIVSATQAGECVSIVGLSGAGKSNLLGFIAHRQGPRYVLVDGNRLTDNSAPGFLRLIRRELGDVSEAGDELTALDALIGNRTREPGPGLTLLLDRFGVAARADSAIHGNLRALRDAHKYRLTYVTATRRPLDPRTELAELFFAHTLWLGPLSEADARWNVAQYAARRATHWDEATTRKIIEVSCGYASLLRATCEAYAEGTTLEPGPLLEHPAIRARVEEFWSDTPGAGDLQSSGLGNCPLLSFKSKVLFDTSQLTAKEHLLFNYLSTHAGEVCEKDDLIRAVWPEDKVFEKGVRDDSLAQLVRRLREKIEPDAANPKHIQTVPGRGYRFAK
jgi:energy-coupling factor transporter ATP-binding protein EcfA2